MRISFSPFAALPGDNRRLTVSRHGDILTINGDTVDLSVIPDGATLPPGAIDNPWIVGPVERIDGVLHVTLLLPHGDFPSPAVAWPTPIALTGNGPVALPHDPAPHDPAPQEADHGND